MIVHFFVELTLDPCGFLFLSLSISAKGIVSLGGRGQILKIICLE
jgi:hypothetical protein